MYQIAIIDNGIPSPQLTMQTEIGALVEAMCLEVIIYRELNLDVQTFVSEVK